MGAKTTLEAGRIERDHYTIRIEIESNRVGYSYALKTAQRVREAIEEAV